MRDTLIEFMDSLRDYVAESGTNIVHDERESSEFVDIFLNQGQTLPIDSVVGRSEQLKAFREWTCENLNQEDVVTKEAIDRYLQSL
jgi:hypothetical protein